MLTQLGWKSSRAETPTKVEDFAGGSGANGGREQLAPPAKRRRRLAEKGLGVGDFGDTAMGWVALGWVGSVIALTKPILAVHPARAPVFV